MIKQEKHLSEDEKKERRKRGKRRFNINQILPSPKIIIPDFMDKKKQKRKAKDDIEDELRET